VGLKDRLIATVALPILNRTLLEPYGEARELRLDSAGKSAEILLALKGDPEPLRVSVGRYELQCRGEETFVTLHGVRTSREWMTALAERNLAGRMVKLPRDVAGVLLKLV
jgi:hypothetical protein